MPALCRVNRSGLLINPASKVAVIALKNSDDGLPLSRAVMNIVCRPIAAAATPLETPAGACRRPGPVRRTLP